MTDDSNKDYSIQSPSSKYWLIGRFLAFGTGSFISIIGYYQRSDSLFLAMFFTVLFVLSFTQMYFFIYKTPECIVAYEKEIHLLLSFGKIVVVPYEKIETIVNDDWLSFLSGTKTKVICPKMDMFWLLPKLGDNNYDAILEIIKSHNPNCLLDDML
jgi:hypothetical protein